MTPSEPTISSILLELADQYHDIVAERDVFERVLARRPSRAKDPYASIRNILRYDSFETGWIRLGGGKLVPRRVALQGLRFRVVPTADEIGGDLLARAKLEPFVLLRMPNPQLTDAQGRPIPSANTRLPSANVLFNFSAVDAQTLNGWYARNGFQPGDSILVTISATAPLTLRLEHEPAAQFRAADVAAHDQALIDAIATQIARNRSTLIPADMVVLPIYAQASWRTGYPGRPWQQLVAEDRRLRLLDDMYIADRSFRRPLDFMNAAPDDAAWAEEDRQLLEEIGALQADLRASRRDAVERGIWNGIAPRASTSQILYDLSEGTSQTVHPGEVDALLDHSESIERRIERGDFASIEWTEPDGDDLSDAEFEGGIDDEELFDIEDIEDMQQFMADNPTLVTATQKLMASLSPSELAALNDAETADQVQMILTKHLNTLLGRQPELFAELTPELKVTLDGSDSQHEPSNGHGHTQDDILAIEVEDEWLPGEDEDEEDDDEWEDEEEPLNEMIERSNALMEQFYLRLIAQGKSESTAAGRTGDLWIYADFLSNYYSRSLDQGDYATLDECLFFYYPRKVINNSARAARDMCTSFKQFYAFLRAEGLIADDSFAQAIWRRRDQVVRVIDLYDQIDADSPQFERLFAHLFAPYTA